MTGRSAGPIQAWRPWTGLGVVGAIFPGILLVIAVGADLLFPAWYCPFSPPLVVVVPALAAATGGIIGAGFYTALSAVVSFFMIHWRDAMELPGGMMPDGMYRGLLSGQLVALGVTFVVSLIPAYLRSRRERTVHRLRLISAAIREAVLVPLPERDGCVRAAAEYLAADDEARLGGDLYDLVDTPYGVRMIIGDVRGKGLAAVASANNLLGAFREIAPTTASLGELAKRLDESVVRHKRRAGLDDEEFVTAALVSVPDGPHAEVLCCGHAGPLIVHDGAVSQVTTEQPWPPLGLGRFASVEPQVVTVPYEVDDTMLLYTDGVTEARDGAGTFYPLRERVGAGAGSGEDPRRLVARLIDDLTAHSGGRLNDDAAILATQRVAPVTEEPGGHATGSARNDAGPTRNDAESDRNDAAESHRGESHQAYTGDRPERRLSGTTG